MEEVKAVCFGVSQYAKRFIEENNSSCVYKVAYFCDNDESKWNHTFEGYSIYPPIKLCEEDRGSLIVIITSRFVDDIAQQLADMGIYNYYIAGELYQQRSSQYISLSSSFYSHLICELSDKNCLSKYFQDFKINEVSIYTEDLRLGELFYREVEKNGINVSALLSDSEKESFWSFTDYREYTPKKNDEVVIIIDKLMRTTPGWLAHKLSKFPSHISLYDIILYDTLYYTLIKPILALENKILHYIVFNYPLLPKVKNPSEFEKYIMDFVDSRSISLSPGRYPEVIDTVFRKHGFSFEYIEDILENPVKLIRSGKELSSGVKENKYKTIVDGHRLNPFFPTTSKNTLHFIGSSTAFGWGAEDKDTIFSQLQLMINGVSEEPFYQVQHHNISGPFIDLSLVQSGFSHWLSDLDIKNGDIVILYDSFSPLAKELFRNSGIPYYDLQPYFDRPHDIGEVFFDYLHMNFLGYRKCAEIIFSVLQNDMSWFSDDNVSIQTWYMADHSGIEGLFYKNSELEEYLGYLKDKKAPTQGKIGSIVMNCNPFTLGHKYLVESAVGMVDYLYIFVVEEDKSVFSFKDRIELVKAGTNHLANVCVIPSGKFIISSLTFPEYFIKDITDEIKIDASVDVEIFAKKIAPVLGISVRFAGEEPLDNITNQYNQTMKSVLTNNGIDFVVIPRLDFKGEPISASRVRALLYASDFDSIKSLVPTSTYEFLLHKNFSAES